jgi:hypothetical protein
MPAPMMQPMPIAVMLGQPSDFESPWSPASATMSSTDLRGERLSEVARGNPGVLVRTG